MATVKYFPRTTQSVHFDNMATWDVYQTGIPDPAWDDPGVFSLNETNPSIILRGGVQQPEPYGWKFSENSRVVMSIYTANLTSSALVSEAKLSVKLKSVYKSGTWGITPSLYLVSFQPPASIGNGGNYGFTATDVYKTNIVKSTVISEDIIYNSVLESDARFEFNLDLSKIDIEYGSGQSYSGHTNIAIVTNYDLIGGIPWSEHQYQQYEFYTQTDPVVDRPYLELTFSESRSHYFEWFDKEETSHSDPESGGSSSLDEGLLSYYKMDNDFTDSKGTSDGSGGTFNSTNKILGTHSALFNNTKSNWTVASLPTGNSARSFSLWVKRIGDSNATSSEYAYYYGNDSNDQIFAFAYERGNSSYGASFYGTDLDFDVSADTNWHHWVLTYDGSGTFKAYQDATLVHTETSLSLSTATGNDLYLGGGEGNSYGGRLFKGYIDGLGIWDRELVSTEVVELYNTGSGTEYNDGFGGSGGDGLVEGEKGDALWDNVTGYYRFNGDVEDRSENSGDIRIIGTTDITTTEVWAGTGALKLTNAYSYRNAIKLEGDTTNFGSGDFCIEFMFKIDENFTLTNNVDYYLMDFREVYPELNSFKYLRLVNNGTSIKLLDQTVSGEIVNSSGVDYTFNVDTWYHIAISKDGSNVRIFIDGDCNNSNISVGNFGGQEIWINSRVDNIGTTYNTDGQGLNIYIDELRITKGNKRYTHGSNFTALTQEHYDYEIPTSVGDEHWSETSLLLKFYETSIYDYSAG